MALILPLIISIVIAQAAGIIGSLFTVSQIPVWYATLAQPSFSPPNWLFGPVWTALYTLMGVASFLVWRKRKQQPQAKQALTVYGVQLGLNTLWSIIFFGGHAIGWAVAEIVILWISIAWTMKAFYRVDKNAAYLLIPYLAWVSFATVLNIALWRLN